LKTYWNCVEICAVHQSSDAK